MWKCLFILQISQLAYHGVSGQLGNLPGSNQGSLNQPYREPSIIGVEAMCSVHGITAQLMFDGRFMGKIYSERYPTTHDCVYYNSYDDTMIMFSMPNYKCGTRITKDARNIIMLIENEIYVQFDKDTQTSSDRRFLFVCENGAATGRGIQPNFPFGQPGGGQTRIVNGPISSGTSGRAGLATGPNGADSGTNFENSLNSNTNNINNDVNRFNNFNTNPNNINSNFNNLNNLNSINRANNGFRPFVPGGNNFGNGQIGIRPSGNDAFNQLVPRAPIGIGTNRIGAAPGFQNQDFGATNGLGPGNTQIFSGTIRPDQTIIVQTVEPRELIAEGSLGGFSQPTVYMQIQDGPGPNDVPVARTLQLGDTISLVVGGRLPNTDTNADLKVHSCYAADGGGQNRVQIIDDQGCTARPSVTESLQKRREQGQVINFAIMKAFKFPTSEDVYFTCSVDTCASCTFPPPCPNGVPPNQVETGKRRKRQSPTNLNDHSELRAEFLHPPYSTRNDQINNNINNNYNDINNRGADNQNDKTKHENATASMKDENLQLSESVRIQDLPPAQPPTDVWQHPPPQPQSGPQMDSRMSDDSVPQRDNAATDRHSSSAVKTVTNTTSTPSVSSPINDMFCFSDVAFALLMSTISLLVALLVGIGVQRFILAERARKKKYSSSGTRTSSFLTHPNLNGPQPQIFSSSAMFSNMQDAPTMFNNHR